MFCDSDHKDELVFKVAISSLVHAPLYVPVTMDMSAMSGGIDPTELKAGEVLQPQKDVRTKIQTVTVNDNEFFTMFTSRE